MENKQRYRRTPYTFDRVIRILFTIAALLAVIFVVDMLSDVLLPFAVACLIAYMLEPVVEWNMRWTHIKRRFIPVMLTLLQFTAIATAIALLLIPYIIDETAQMTTMLRQYAETQIEIPYVSQSFHDFIRDNIDFDRISQLLSKDEWKDLARNAISSSWGFVSSGLSFILSAVSWLIVVLYVIFIMIDYDRINESFKKMVPARHRDKTLSIFNDIKKTTNRYFRGQFVIASIVGALFAVGFTVIGLPMGVILGIFIGLLNLVPYLQLISLPITALLCLVCTASTGVPFWEIFWESMAVYAIVQVLQDLVLTPKIMGSAMGLNPAILLLALSVWGSLLGFIGLIIALPLTTLLLSYYKQYIDRQEDRDLFDAETTTL